ncbi:MAG: hypothetical protein OXD44_03345 [Gammaproteobacteria bacterium]|nr:hypothetical protein [Gammaproteobacteria bacterium]MCY4312728.1 hypothetical protein [Gammaproteobacteria bacterium]
MQNERLQALILASDGCSLTMTGMLPGTVGHCNPRSGTWLVASARNLRFFVSRRIPMRPNGLRPVPCEQVCAFAIQGCCAMRPGLSRTAREGLHAGFGSPGTCEGGG